MQWTYLCDESSLLENQGLFVEAAGKELAVFKTPAGVYTMLNYCPHAGGNMAGGFVEDGCAVCPWHYWAFKLDTGELAAGGCKIPTYETRIKGGIVEAILDRIKGSLPVITE